MTEVDGAIMALTPPAPPPVPPPPGMANISEAFRWLATVSAQAGYPIFADVMGAELWVNVTLPNMIIMSNWMAITGADGRTSENDDLGVWATATSQQIGRWAVRLHCHVPFPSASAKS